MNSQCNGITPLDVVVDRGEIFRTVVRIFEEETGLELPTVDERTQLRAELELNSIDFIAPVMKLEDRYHVRFQHTDLANTHSFGDVVELIAAKLHAGVAAELETIVTRTSSVRATIGPADPNTAPIADAG